MTIPEDFAFETSQTVALEVEVAEQVFEGRVDAPVEIKKPNGATVFRGAIRKGQNLSIQVPVAKHIDHLDVTVPSPSGAKQARLELVGQRASGRVE